MGFGLYIHIPYCIQKCHYCDFTTFDLNHVVSMKQYSQLIMSELRSRAKAINNKNVTSIYFGGGTPSLLPAEDILAIRNEISAVGFNVAPDSEITIEINPGTVTPAKLDLYLESGVNRFSVGVQTFNDAYLKTCGREHSANTSRETLRFLEKNMLNYSFDLLFGLPNQTQAELLIDLNEMLTFSPQHVSLYNLTVPMHHKMNARRAPDEEQAEMFEIIEKHLTAAQIFRYELSNFARPGHESKHNQLYWSDAPYWGLGVSAHSYTPSVGRWGTRYWNPTSYKEYIKQVSADATLTDPFAFLPARQIEHLKMNEALTDYCHTQLRMMRGLTIDLFEKKFGSEARILLMAKAEKLIQKGLLLNTASGFCLSPSALPIANQVFFEFTFLPEEIAFSTH